MVLSLLSVLASDPTTTFLVRDVIPMNQKSKASTSGVLQDLQESNMLLDGVAEDGENEDRR